MTLYKNRYRIESARCPNWDYASNGWYFVTICTHDRRCFLGTVVAGRMQLSAAGELVQKIWEDIPQRFPHVVLDNFVAMPNHVHGIILIDRDPPGRDAINRVSTTIRRGSTAIDRVPPTTIDRGSTTIDPGSTAIERVPPTIQGGDATDRRHDRGGITSNHNPMLSDDSLSKMMRWYKGRCKFEIRPILPEFGWQPRFHDHIIRDEMALNRIRDYIATNPQKWNDDRYYRG